MIDCINIASRYKEKLKLAIAGRPVGLAIIQAGNDYASQSYTKGKIKDCSDVGIDIKHIDVSDTRYEDIIDTICMLNDDDNIDGIMVQLPLPQRLHRHSGTIFESISVHKDVDGIRKDSRFMQCTPLGIMILLDDIGYDITGKKCCVVGRGKTVGKPVVDILMSNDATVICCHSKTSEADKRELISCSDVIITATGIPRSITPDMVHDGQIIIDAGISRDEDGKICGDCDRGIYSIVNRVTSVPNGIGLLTRIALLINTVDAAQILRPMAHRRYKQWR